MKVINAQTIAKRHQSACAFAFPAKIDRTAAVYPQMAEAMVSLRRVLGTCYGRDLVAVGFTLGEVTQFGQEARKLASEMAPGLAANDDNEHVSDEDIAATIDLANGVRASSKRA